MEGGSSEAGGLGKREGRTERGKQRVGGVHESPGEHARPLAATAPGPWGPRLTTGFWSSSEGRSVTPSMSVHVV